MVMTTNAMKSTYLTSHVLAFFNANVVAQENKQKKEIKILPLASLIGKVIATTRYIRKHRAIHGK